MFSKTDILAMVQCPRQLWLRTHRPELASEPDSSLDRRAIDGNVVGERARQALGKDFIWPPGGNDKREGMAKAIRMLLASPTKPAVEVPLVREDLYSRADALIPENFSYVLQETKASTFPLKSDKSTPAKPDEWYVNDVAIQAWVMEASGLPMHRAELNLLDNRWRYPGDNDYRGLFRPQDITEEVEKRKGFVPIWLAQAREVIAGVMPVAVTGKQCKDPHECPFKAHCESIDPPKVEHPIELLPDSAGKALAKKLKDNLGYKSILEPRPEELTGTNAVLYRRIQFAHETGEAVLVPGADTVMQALPYPRYYFDFEGIDLPVPYWPGVRPYEQVPFQWSCHIEHSPGVFTHHAFLDVSGNDPSLPCAERMREVIKDDGGPIFVFFATYERGRMQDLGMRHPEHAAAMDRFISRLVDLLPLVKGHYYDPRMKGSFSIKKVLPCIAPDLDYSELEGVQEGTGAQVAYLNAAFEGGLTDAQRETIRRNLLAYCDQDTWAMVEVAYFLEKKPRPHGLRPDSDGTPLQA